MVISITPNGRASKFNDLAKLSITYTNGVFETPNRIVNKHDLNAKDGIGADIPLTRTSKSFMLQENINPEKLEMILTKNGYLGEMLANANRYTQRVDTSKSLVFVYPAITMEAMRMLNAYKSAKLMRFCCEFAKRLGVESLMFPTILGMPEMLSLTNEKNLQLIPVLDLKAETHLFSEQFDACKVAEAANVPIIGLRFATYPNANQAYDIVMDNLDKLHENGQATMIVDSPRFLRSDDCLNASAPHYGSFFIGDMIAESYHTGGSSRKRKVRVFCRKDLVTPTIEPELRSKRKIELESELAVFDNDKRLQDLMKRIVNDNTTDYDWNGNRPIYLSRVHENIRSREEFQTFQKYVDSDNAGDYLSEKKDMNTVVKAHLQNRSASLAKFF